MRQSMSHGRKAPSPQPTSPPITHITITITIYHLSPRPRHSIRHRYYYTSFATMSTTVSPSIPHISGHRSSHEPPHHGINDGSGDSCGTHSYTSADEHGKAVSRDQSLTEILISKGLKEANFLSAIVSLGEGMVHSIVFINSEQFSLFCSNDVLTLSQFVYL